MRGIFWKQSLADRYNSGNGAIGFTMVLSFSLIAEVTFDRSIATCQSIFGNGGR